MKCQDWAESLRNIAFPLGPNSIIFQQLPIRMSKEVELKVKEEIEKFLKAKFIKPMRYVQWLANIVPVIMKNGKLRVCVNFRDLNVATPKNMYVMPIADMLVDSAANNELLSFIDGFSGYNQILIVVEDMPKTAFRCPGSIRTFEWQVMPFSLKKCRCNLPKGNECHFP